MTKRCQRCGIDREVNESRDIPPLCRDCEVVERDTAALEDWHGTNAGYFRHWRAGELACEPCARAHAITGRDHNRATYGHAPRTIPTCGTNAGYQVHRRKGEPACDPCRLAHNEQTRTSQRRRKAAA